MPIPGIPGSGSFVTPEAPVDSKGPEISRNKVRRLGHESPLQRGPTGENIIINGGVFTRYPIFEDVGKPHPLCGMAYRIENGIPEVVPTPELESLAFAIEENLGLLYSEVQNRFSSGQIPMTPWEFANAMGASGITNEAITRHSVGFIGPQLVRQQALLGSALHNAVYPRMHKDLGEHGFDVVATLNDHNQKRMDKFTPNPRSHAQKLG